MSNKSLDKKPSIVVMSNKNIQFIIQLRITAANLSEHACIAGKSVYGLTTLVPLFQQETTNGCKIFSGQIPKLVCDDLCQCVQDVAIRSLVYCIMGQLTEVVERVSTSVLSPCHRSLLIIVAIHACPRNYRSCIPIQHQSCTQPISSKWAGQHGCHPRDISHQPYFRALMII